MAEKLQTNQSINQFTFIKQKSLIYSTHLQAKRSKGQMLTSKRDVRSLASSLTTVMLTFHSTIQLRSQNSFESGSNDLLDLNYLPSRWWNEINTARWIVGGMLTFMTSFTSQFCVEFVYDCANPSNQNCSRVQRFANPVNKNIIIVQKILN